MARTAKKKVAVYDEGILLVEDVDSIDFDGIGVEGSAIGNAITEKIPGTNTPDYFKSRVSINDTTPNYLVNKLLAGTGITITKENPGANEDLKVSIDTTFADLTYWRNDGLSTATGNWDLGAYKLAGYQRYIGENAIAQTTALDFMAIKNGITIADTFSMNLSYPHGNLVAKGKIFLSSNSGSSPQYIKIFNNPTVDMSDVTTLTFNSSYGIPAMCYDAGTDRVYAITSAEAYGNPLIIRINPNNNTYDTIAAPSGTTRNSCIATNGTYLYVGIQHNIRVYTMAGAYVLDMASVGGTIIHAMKTTYDGTVIATGYNNGEFYKINSTNNTFSTLILTGFTAPTDDFIAYGDYAYLGDEAHTPGHMAVVNWKTMTFREVTGVSEAYFVSRKGHEIYLGGKDGTCSIYNIDTDTVTNNFALGNTLFNELEFIGDYGFMTRYIVNSPLYKVKLDPVITNISIVDNLGSGNYGLHNISSLSSVGDFSMHSGVAGTGFYFDESGAFGHAGDMIFYQGTPTARIVYQIIKPDYSDVILPLTMDGVTVDFGLQKVKTTDSMTAGSFVKVGGTSSQFLKANGSVDSSTYISSLSGALLATGATTGATSQVQTFLNGIRTTGNVAITYTGSFVNTITIGSRVITFSNNGTAYTSWTDTVNTWTPTYTSGNLTALTVS